MSTTSPRVLEVLHSYGIGGSQLVGLELARRLQGEGIEVLCGALDQRPGPLLQRCKDYGLQVIDLAVPWRHPLGRNGLSPGLIKRLKGLHLEAVHVQHFVGLHKLGLPARLAGIERIVVTEHSVFDVDQSAAGRLRARLNWRLATAITVVHQGIKDYLCKRLNVRAERISVIPVGIEVERFHRDDRPARRRELGISDEMVFVFVGRLAPVKNVPQLVEAFLAVQSAGAPRARLLIIGDGEEMGQVRLRLQGQPFGDRVTLVGEQSDVRPYLAAADVFVLNSSSEGMPRALLEAMAVGLPAISPAVGSIPEVIAAGRGWMTDSRSRPSLENAMRRVLSDPRAVEDSGNRSRSYVRQHFDSRSIAAQYRRLLAS